MASINGSVERMTTQLDDLLEVARLRSGTPLELRRSTVDLGALVEGWAADYQRTTERHIVAVDPIEEPVVCSVDVNRIERVVTNLLSNAIKYSDGGVIRVRIGWEAAEGGRDVVLSVIDQGVGISDEDLPAVFQRFQRGSNAEGRAAGTGIGLAGVQQIVLQHGGTISVESKVSVGSTFTVRIPCLNG
jgi:signal transduction histidine kinase